MQNNNNLSDHSCWYAALHDSYYNATTNYPNLMITF